MDDFGSIELIVKLAFGLVGIYFVFAVILPGLSRAKSEVSRRTEDLDVTVDGRHVSIDRSSDLVGADCTMALLRPQRVEFSSGWRRGAFSLTPFVTGDADFDEVLKFATNQPGRVLAALSASRRETLRIGSVLRCGILGDTAYLTVDRIEHDPQQRHDQVAPFFRLIESLNEWVAEIDDTPAALLALMRSDPEVGVRREAFRRLVETCSKSSARTTAMREMADLIAIHERLPIIDVMDDDAVWATAAQMLRAGEVRAATIVELLKLLAARKHWPNDVLGAARNRIKTTNGFIAANMLQAIPHIHLGLSPDELQTLIEDGEASTAAAAFSQVRYLDDAAALPLITLGFERYSPRVWPAAMKGLVERGTPEALATARELLADDSPDEARREALQALLTQSGQAGGLAVVEAAIRGGELALDKSSRPR